MLILLDQSIVSSVTALSNNEVMALEDLLSCHSRLFHYVGATKKIASDLIEKLGARLSNRSLQTLELISSQANDLNAITKSALLYAKVSCDGPAGMFVEETADVRVWVCDIEYAARWFSQPSTLIGENLDDTRIFKIASQDAALEIGFPLNAQRLNTEMSGGTGNAPDVLRNRIDTGLCPVLCILDSDKFFPGASNSPSVDKCHEVVAEMGGVTRFFEIKPREVENLLPAGLLKGAISMLPQSSDRDVIESRLVNLLALKDAFPVIYRHIDFKNGTCRTWVTKNNVHDFFKPVATSAPCSCQADCEGQISSGLFHDVLTKVLEFADSRSPIKMNKSLKGEDRPEWLGLGKIVLAFSYANRVRLS